MKHLPGSCCQQDGTRNTQKTGILRGSFPHGCRAGITNTRNKKPPFSGSQREREPSFPPAAVLARIYRRLITFKIFFSIVGVGTGTGTPGSRTSYSLGGSCVTGQLRIKLFPPHDLYFKCQAI